MATLERAIQIAAEVHAGQVDKGGERYILHPLRVMLHMKSDDARIAAVLHDVVEDGLEKGWTLERLRSEGFSPVVLKAIDHLTKREDEEDDYARFIERVALDPLAVEVKIADLTENMDLRRLGREPTEKDLRRLEKYKRSIARLEEIRRREGRSVFQGKTVKG